jgi:NTP pyrophosphatase (non-canonical NTP hydrolase)
MFFPDEIQLRALNHWYEGHHRLHSDLMPSVLGLVGEVGELADLHKKHVFKPDYCAKPGDYLDELGDALFYLAIAAAQCGVTLDELSEMNYEKLNERARNGTGYNRGNDR